tara:strand:- start:2989 stop:3798 length:810 start_codon:yes stop_codon:yes gene_type:complete
MNKILIIGCGHMGNSLLSAWSTKTKNSFVVIDPLQYSKINKKFNKKVLAFKNLNQIVNFQLFDIIIFAVKPQIISKVLEDLKKYKFKKSVLFASIVAGKKIKFYEKFLPKKNQFVRLMPNMPAMIKQGMTCFCVNQNISNLNIKKIKTLLSIVGQSLLLKDENDLDKVTAISGSGPGYVFLFIDAFEKAALKLGLGEKNTKKLVSQTIQGSINLFIQKNISAENLANNIAVKGGTTEAGLNELNKKESIEIKLKKAVRSAYKRAKQLGN